MIKKYKHIRTQEIVEAVQITKKSYGEIEELDWIEIKPLDKSLKLFEIDGDIVDEYDFIIKHNDGWVHAFNGIAMDNQYVEITK